jgi:hypothetical protein
VNDRLKEAKTTDDTQRVNTEPYYQSARELGKRTDAPPVTYGINPFASACTAE